MKKFEERIECPRKMFEKSEVVLLSWLPCLTARTVTNAQWVAVLQKF
jgi:hypothetical protein